MNDNNVNNTQKLKLKIINLCPHINLYDLELSDLQRLYDVLVSCRKGDEER